jgi:hypothetical protein
VGLDGIAGVVIDRAGSQVVLGHAEAFLDAPELVVGLDDELWWLADQVGGVVLPPGKRAGLGLQCAVHRLGGSGQLDVAVAFDRGMAVDGALGLGDLLVDAA